MRKVNKRSVVVLIITALLMIIALVELLLIMRNELDIEGNGQEAGSPVFVEGDIAESPTSFLSATPSGSLVTPSPTISSSGQGSDSGTPWDIRGHKERVFVTQNETLEKVLEQLPVGNIEGFEEVKAGARVYDETIGLDCDENGKTLAAEFYLVDDESENLWYRVVYDGEKNVAAVEDCTREKREFLENHEWIDYRTAWLKLRNTVKDNAMLVFNASEYLYERLNQILFQKNYYEEYESLNHDAAERILGEQASYGQFIWYAENLKGIIEDRITDSLSVSYQGVEERENENGKYYCVGVQFENYVPATGTYEDVLEVWCVLFPSESDSRFSFWLFGPDILNRIKTESD